MDQQQEGTHDYSAQQQWIIQQHHLLSQSGKKETLMISAFHTSLYFNDSYNLEIIRLNYTQTCKLTSMDACLNEGFSEQLLVIAAYFTENSIKFRPIY
jgi:hypothetical protein